MRLLIFILLLSLQATGQRHLTMKVRAKAPAPAGPTCPMVLTFGSLSNFTENTPGTYTLTAADADGNGVSADTLIGTADSCITYFEYQSADGFQSAISWDTISTTATSYYSYAKFNVFVYAEGYWANYNQEGAINTTVAAIDGDLVGLIRRGTKVFAAYYRAGTWHDLREFEGDHSGTLFQFISCANDGSTFLKIRNLKYCVYQ